MCFLKAIVSWHHDFAESFWHRGTVSQTSSVSLWVLVAFEKVPVSSGKQKGINVFYQPRAKLLTPRCQRNSRVRIFKLTMRIPVPLQNWSHYWNCFSKSIWSLDGASFVRKELRVKLSWHCPFKENTAFLKFFCKRIFPMQQLRFIFGFTNIHGILTK